MRVFVYNNNNKKKINGYITTGVKSCKYKDSLTHLNQYTLLQRFWLCSTIHFKVLCSHAWLSLRRGCRVALHLQDWGHKYLTWSISASRRSPQCLARCPRETTQSENIWSVTGIVPRKGKKMKFRPICMISLCRVFLIRTVVCFQTDYNFRFSCNVSSKSSSSLAVFKVLISPTAISEKATVNSWGWRKKKTWQ